MSAALKVVRPGLFDTLQDLGRTGFMALGMMLPGMGAGCTTKRHWPPARSHTAKFAAASPAPGVITSIAGAPAVFAGAIANVGAGGGIESSQGVAGTSAGVAYGPAASASLSPRAFFSSGTILK